MPKVIITPNGARFFNKMAECVKILESQNKAEAEEKINRARKKAAGDRFFEMVINAISYFYHERAESRTDGPAA